MELSKAIYCLKNKTPMLTLNECMISMEGRKADKNSNKSDGFAADLISDKCQTEVDEWT